MLLTLLLLACAGSGPQGPQPVLELPNASFALGESVFFWVGVSSSEALDQEAYEARPCHVEITHPDRRTTTSSIHWPADGDRRLGWRGGSGLETGEARVGQYRVRVSCGSEMVTDYFDVRELPQLSEIQTGFSLSSGCHGDPYDRTITLWLANGSNTQLVVASPEHVGFAARQLEPRAECHAFFPPEAMGLRSPRPGDVLADSLSYASLSQIEHSAVDPGEGRQWTFCASSGLSQCPALSATVKLDLFATLHFLLGPATSEEAMSGPYRLPVVEQLSIDMSQIFFSHSWLSAAEVSLRSGATNVTLSSDQSADLSERLDTHFRSCQPYSRVMRDGVLPQETLTKRWAEQEQSVHALLHFTYSSDAPPHLQNKTLDVQFGFPTKDLLGPVFVKNASQEISSYIRCGGYESLLLACHVHSLVPGVQPNSRCQEWQELMARYPVPASEPQEPE